VVIRPSSIDTIGGWQLPSADVGQQWRTWEELDIEALVATFKLSRKRAVIVR